MNLFYSDEFVLPLPPGHRFPMAKYRRLRDRLVEEGLDEKAELNVPEAATDLELATAHDDAYLKKVTTGTLTPQEVRRIGFPWSPELVERSRRSVGGTLAAGFAAMEEGIAMNLSGGTHHAFPDHGEGFCVFNDVAVAVRVMMERGAVERVAILDLDVHQGNGTAFVFGQDPRVFTLSVHGANNYPFRKERSDLDLDLPDGTQDELYLDTVSRGVARAMDHASPELVFYLAGADPFAGDRLGRMGVSKKGLAARDHLVFSECQERRARVAVVMSGGYAPNIEDTVDIHLATARAALAFHGRL